MRCNIKVCDAVIFKSSKSILQMNIYVNIQYLSTSICCCWAFYTEQTTIGYKTGIRKIRKNRYIRSLKGTYFTHISVSFRFFS